MTLSLGKLNSILLDLFPAEWACDWDNVGLIAGHPSHTAQKILIALELTSDVMKEAVKIKADAIISHHPPYLTPPKKFNLADSASNLIASLFKNNIGLIALHTNADQAPNGINIAIAKKLGLSGIRFIDPQYKLNQYKLVVFTPRDCRVKIIDAIAEAGGGIIGNYKRCAFYVDGIGTFEPQQSASPFIGKPGKIEEVEECRIEAVVSGKNLAAAISGVRKIHPYEEPAIDVYPLRTTLPDCGSLTAGELPEAVPLSDIIKIAKNLFHADTIGIVSQKSDKEKIPVKRVAICSGAGGSMIRRLSPNDIDLYITGEAGHHDMLDAIERGLNVALCGHFSTETIFTEILLDALKNHKTIKDNKISIAVSKKMQNPIKYF